MPVAVIPTGSGFLLPDYSAIWRRPDIWNIAARRGVVHGPSTAPTELDARTWEPKVNPCGKTRSGRWSFWPDWQPSRCCDQNGNWTQRIYDPLRASSDINPVVLGSPADAACPSFQSGPSWVLFRADGAAVLWRVYQKMNDNRLLAVAAGVVFYGLLAVFPAITAFVSLYGLLADPSTLHERLSTAAGILPQGALNIL